MLIQNHNQQQTHGEVIRQRLSRCQRADLMVSYIKNSGVHFLGKSLRACLGRDGGKVRVLCTLEMEISHPEAIKRLVQLGAEVKVYENKWGNYHPKLWIFSDREGGECIVGSANMSESAMVRNVEVSAVLPKDGADFSSAKEVFEFYWNSENATEATADLLDTMIAMRASRAKALRAIQRQAQEQAQEQMKEQVHTAKNVLEALQGFIASWVSIGTGITTAEGRGQLWRGWYLVPDQGYVKDVLMHRLHRICGIIGAKPLDISKGSTDPRMPKILAIVEEKLAGKKDKTPKRGLFIRQEKNYLVSFNLAQHATSKNGKPNKGMLVLTPAGIAFAKAKTTTARKKIYTEEIQSYVYNGLEIFRFVKELLNNVGHITLDEFNYFVCHAYTMRELDTITRLIGLYRGLPAEQKEALREAYIALFNQHLEHKKNVRGNYEKKSRHMLFAFGWCTGMGLEVEENQNGGVTDMTLKRA